MTTVIVAEKPSVARDIARVVRATQRHEGYLEGAGYRVSWAVGHLLELCEPEAYDPAWKTWSFETLPMLPPSFRTRPRKGGGKQLAVLRALFRAPDVERVVNACDAGREGELIFRWLWEHAGPRRGRSPRLERLWTASLTDGALRKALAGLQPATHFARLGDAARCRAEADWLVGLNATRAMTLRGRRAGAGRALLSIGRVQTPTLAMLVQREDEIDAFVSEPFWRVKATFAPDRGRATYEGIYQRPRPEAGPGGQPESWPGDRLKTEAAAHAIAAAVAGQPGLVAQVERRESSEQAPALYDLTSLQQAANRRAGLSAARTLAAAQGLYERHKAITYPRTDSRFLTPDVAAKLPALLPRLAVGRWQAAAQAAITGGSRPTRKVIDVADVGDHHAILPTGKLPAPDSLSSDERVVLDLVIRRTLAVHLPAARFAKTRIWTEVAVGGTTHRFMTDGKTRLEEGWHLAEPPSQKRRAAEQAAAALPIVDNGETVATPSARVEAGKTEPPNRYSEATLLSAMENAGRQLDEVELRRALKRAGLGTPATRAAIIETLLRREFVRRDKKVLQATAQGRALIAALPPSAASDALRSPELTGRWESQLAEMADGRGDRETFMAAIRRYTTELVTAMATDLPTAEATQGLREAAAADAGDREVLGRCPVCGTPVTEGRKAYTCANGRECAFVIFKQVVGKKISPPLAQVLLSRGRSRRLKGFRSKAGKRFEAALVLTPEGKVELDFERPAPASVGVSATKPKPKPKPTPAERAVAGPQGPKCPRCGHGRIIKGRRGWGCSAYRDGCDFVVWFVQGPANFTVPGDEADRLFRRKQTRLMEGLLPDGKARLVLDLAAPGNVRIERSKRGRASTSEG